MRGLSTVLYGTSGSGKTYQALKFPRDEVLMISFARDDSTLHGSNIHRTIIDSDSLMSVDGKLSKFESLYHKLRTEKHQFKVVFLDDFCLYSNYVVEMLRVVRELGFPRRNEKENAVHESVRWIKNFVDLTEKGIDVVFTTWDMTFNTEDGLTSSPMQINWEVTNYLCGLCNNVWEIYRDEDFNSEQRFIRTKGSRLLKGKTKLPPDVKLPFEGIMPDPNLCEMLKKLKGAIGFKEEE